MDKFINIGFGNLVSLSRIVTIVTPDSAPIKRLVQESRDRFMVVDSTFGRKTRSVIIMDTNHIILSSLQTETINNKIKEVIKNG